MAKTIGMILDESFPPDPRVENEASLLIKAGYTVKLFCLGKETNTESYKGIQIYRYKASNFVMEKLSALAYTFPFYKLFIKKHIKSFIESNKIDILHIHDIRVAESVFELNRKYNLCTILDMHENRPEIMKLYKFVNSFPGNILINLNKWKKKEEKYVRLADRVIVVTDEARKELINRVNIDESKIVSLPNTPLQSFYKEYTINQDIIERYKDSFNLLYIGETGLRRGIENAIEAISLLKNDIPNIKLILVGKSKDDSYLKGRVKELNIIENIDYQGWQSPSSFASYISASQVGISPLIRNIHHDTTYANKIFQYMAFGLPIIVSDCPAQADVVKNKEVGLVHEAANSRDLANCIYKLYKNTNLYNTMQSNSKTLVEDYYNWEKTGVALTDLYSTM